VGHQIFGNRIVGDILPDFRRQVPKISLGLKSRFGTVAEKGLDAAGNGVTYVVWLSQWRGLDEKM
jgi:hypothetical protein